MRLALEWVLVCSILLTAGCATRDEPVAGEPTPPTPRLPNGERWVLNSTEPAGFVIELGAREVGAVAIDILPSAWGDDRNLRLVTRADGEDDVWQTRWFVVEKGELRSLASGFNAGAGSQEVELEAQHTAAQLLAVVATPSPRRVVISTVAEEPSNLTTTGVIWRGESPFGSYIERALSLPLQYGFQVNDSRLAVAQSGARAGGELEITALLPTRHAAWVDLDWSTNGLSQWSAALQIDDESQTADGVIAGTPTVGLPGEATLRGAAQEGGRISLVLEPTASATIQVTAGYVTVPLDAIVGWQVPTAVSIAAPGP